ncbi:CASP-like protein 1E1 [Asparagus officinalis]|uniref:CASP-like protein 1E1 n=1 Tax=Asparagus officinalis TaxID=4686 RepID=UPI00098E3BEC|nr:CASP-like protein 1E1 [Asparagus officinalis]
MEPQIKPTSNGTQDVVASHGYNNSRSTFDGYNFRPSSSSPPSSSKFLSSSRIQLAILILRSTTLILTFIAAIVMGTGKGRTRVSVTDPITMKTANFIETVRAKYSSALVYFVVTNVLMFLYSASSLAILFLIKETSRYIQLSFAISDVLFLILLFSNNGASITTSLTMENGNTELGWIKICDAVNTFCAHVTAAIVLSVFASIAHLVIVLLEVIGMHVGD